jgi:hypothetical protein
MHTASWTRIPIEAVGSDHGCPRSAGCRNFLTYSSRTAVVGRLTLSQPGHTQQVVAVKDPNLTGHDDCDQEHSDQEGQA